MKYLLITVIFSISTQSAFAGLSEALTAAIESSDKQKQDTKVVLNVTNEQIEKATFKKGQKTEIIREQSSVMVDDASYAANSQAQAEEEVEDLNTSDMLKKELSDLKK